MVPFKYRPDIDGLRALAVVSVVLFHSNTRGFAGGFIGVDVFFVISGFLITQLLINKIETTGTISLMDFYSSRFKRLMPAIFVLILSVSIAWALLFKGLPEETLKFTESIRYSVTGFANIFFLNNTQGYFDNPNHEMPLLHFWSLAVEEQFYFVYPLLLIFLTKIKKINFRYSLKVLLALIIIFSFYKSYQLLKLGWQKESFYYMHSRAWELGMGGITYFIVDQKFFKDSKFINFLSFLGLSLIVFSIYSFEAATTPFPGVNALFPVLGTAFIIISGQSAYVNKILSNKVFVFIGLISYGLYLWHWPLIVFLRIKGVPLSPLLSQFLPLVLGIVFATISLYLIERPIRFGKISAKNSVILGLLSMVLLILISYGLVGYSNYFLKKLGYENLNELMKERTNLTSKCFGTVGDFDYKNCLVTTKNPAKNLIFMWGDSMGYAAFPLVEQYIKENPETAATLLSSFSRPPLWGIEAHWFNKSVDWTEGTTAINSKVFEEVKKMVGDFENVSVMIWSNWDMYAENSSYVDSAKTRAGSLRVINLALKQTVKQLHDLGVKKILVSLPYPDYGLNLMRCIAFKGESSCSIDRSLYEKQRSEIVAVVKDTIKDIPYVRYIDPAPHVCDENKCHMISQFNGSKIPMTWDSSHPSSPAARLLLSKISDEMKWLEE